MKKVLLFIFTTIVFNCNSKDSNMLRIGISSLQFSNLYISNQTYPSIIEFSYTKFYRKKYSIGLEFKSQNLVAFLFGSGNILIYENNILDVTSVNKIFIRKNLNNIKIDFGYNYLLKKIEITPVFSIGLICTNNEYLTKIILAPPPPNGMGDLIYSESKFKNEIELGLGLGFNIKYPIYRDKLLLGASINHHINQKLPYFNIFTTSFYYKF
jgi:hypothetical protein